MRPPKSRFRRTYQYEALMRYAKRLGFGDIHTKVDPQTGLHAIIAIHNVSRGPAIGGCRIFPYKTAGEAFKDVLRLAYMMTLKAAIADLSHGGAKAVIIKPEHIEDHDAFFSSFGDFVHEMNGRYITAIDVGTSTKDMDVIASRTPYVIGAAAIHSGHGDPATHTALGVFRGIQAAVAFQHQQDTLKGITVAIQGTGHVGFGLAKRLHDAGAHLIVCDTSTEHTQRCADTLNATVVDPADIYHVQCDVFAPCAMGGILTMETIEQLQTHIICGSANNQLAHAGYADRLKAKDILYVPDFIVNSGGLINAAMVYDYADEAMATKQIMKIYDTLLTLFERAATTNQTTTAVAQAMAWERLQ